MNCELNWFSELVDMFSNTSADILTSKPTNMFTVTRPTCKMFTSDLVNMFTSDWANMFTRDFGNMLSSDSANMHTSAQDTHH